MCSCSSAASCKQFRLHAALLPVSRLRGFLENIADALEAGRQRSKVLRVADGLDGRDALDRVHQVVRAGGEGGVDLVIGEAVPLPQDVARPLQQEFQHLVLRRLR